MLYMNIGQIALLTALSDYGGVMSSKEAYLLDFPLFWIK